MTNIMMSDNSMEPKIERGDILFIDENDVLPRDGSIFLVSINNGDIVLIRRLWEREHGLFLEPINKVKCNPTHVPYDSDYKILGRLKEIRRQL